MIHEDDDVEGKGQTRNPDILRFGVHPVGFLRERPFCDLSLYWSRERRKNL